MLTLIPSLGFVFFGMVAAAVLTYWYVAHTIRSRLREGTLVYTIITAMKAQVPRDVTGFHLLFPEHTCPCCGNHVEIGGEGGSIVPLLNMIFANLEKEPDRLADLLARSASTLTDDELNMIGALYHRVRSKKET